MISLGDANTRERDYADVLILSKRHAVGARGLWRALEETHAYHGTELLPLTDVFDSLPTVRQAGWKAFVDRTSLIDVLPKRFEQVVRQVSKFVDSILRDDSGLEHCNPPARAWD